MTALPSTLAAALSSFSQEEVDPLGLFRALFDAIRPGRREPPQAAAARYQVLVEALEADAGLARRVGHHLRRLLAGRRMVGFFADSGILPATGFFTELGRIVTARLLPELPEPDELRDVLRTVFHGRRDWVWLQEIPDTVSLRFWRAVTADRAALSSLLVPVLDQMLEALLVLAYRVAGTDFESEFGRLGPEFKGFAPRFRGLARAAQRFVDGCRARLADPAHPAEDEAELLVLVDQCEEVIERARRAALKAGTSLRLTYLLRRTSQSLRRIDTLARLAGIRLRAESAQEQWQRALQGMTELVRAAVRAENRRDSLREHVLRGISLLALRVTDHAAKTGEHYIAETRTEYLAMWRAAMGAGLLIGAMALLKILVSYVALPPAAYALLYSLIYGLGFVLIFMLGLTVATKQPAMTAQTIAGYLQGARPGAARLAPAELDRVVDLFEAVSRSQFAAIAGNLIVALSTAVLLAVSLARGLDAPVVTAEKAAHLLHDLHPAGWAIPHAALAGVFLYLSGLISGYFDNKASYARVGERIARLRWLNAAAGPARAARVGTYVEQNLGGLMGNFLFGCMLGTAGTVGLILGLPIDIRHIAFSAANLGYAWAGSGFDLPPAVLALAALGVGLIGLTNLAVSFVLAFWTALRARGVAFTQGAELLARVGTRFRRAPLAFFIAPRAG